MSLGPRVRALFGRYERQVSDAYRAVYLDLDAFLELILAWAPSPRRILEIGCGEGAITERLAAAYPQASILAIDVSPRLGRMYRGREDGVRFEMTSVSAVARTNADYFDCVILADVVHHVSMHLRDVIFSGAKQALSPGGTLIFKDWVRSATPIHWLCHLSDRWLTGDQVAYMTDAEMRRHLERSFGNGSLVATATIGPWRNNAAFCVRS